MFVDELPAPTWTHSDNNLLPQWLRYLKWHQSEYARNELSRARENLRAVKESAVYYENTVKSYAPSIKEAREKLITLRAPRVHTDDDISTHYAALLASPHVEGVRTDRWGGLVVRVLPKLKGDGKYYGTYEINSDSLAGEGVWFLGSRRGLLYQCFRGLGLVTYGQANRNENMVCVQMSTYGVMTAAIDKAKNYDVLALVDEFVHNLEMTLDSVNFRNDDIPKDEILACNDTPGNPVQAMRQMVLQADNQSIEEQISRTERRLKMMENDKAYYLENLREIRVQIRALTSDIRKLEAQKTADKDVDIELAKQTLRYISMLDGVIAIRFDGVVPVLHVRNSFVYAGKRYDLGDFEIRLELEVVHFGTVLKVRQTRRPAGGLYTAGWHEGFGFCFGRARAESIEEYFRTGDFAHAINLALGTMNSLSKGDDFMVENGFFAEIPLQNIWRRTLRNRPRRKAKVA